MRLVDRPLSLRNRVALTGVLVLGLGIIVLTLLVNVAVVTSLRGQADDLLRARAQAAAATVNVDGSGQLSVQDSRNDSAIDVGTWIFQGQQILESPAGASDLDARAAALAGQSKVFVQTDDDVAVRWYAEPVLIRGKQAGTVVTSIPLSPYQTTTRVMLGGTSALAVLLIAAVWIALRVGVGRALQPVADMTHQGAQWSVDDTHRRFGPGRRPEELEDLAATLDGLLERLESALRSEERLSAEISHELRTPIARMQAELELLGQQPRSSEKVQQGLAVLEMSTSEMSQILEILMDTARSPGDAAPGRCDVVPVVDDVLADRASDRVLSAVSVSGGTHALVDPRVLERALAPIFDNAFRFAASRIDVEIRGDAASVVVDIRDDGPGIEPDDLEQIFSPGFSASAPGGHPGAGLGLALSRRLFVALGGSVEAKRSEQGALLVVSLPRA
ncbi:MAG: HAMP domain-containing histidine kinase [Actinomycetia bacterium]|nr:HAMP domain-containing histidine kinase [Actinomycetes bacterium]